MKLNHFQKKIAVIKFFTIVLFTFAYSFKMKHFLQHIVQPLAGYLLSPVSIIGTAVTTIR
jgi:hypothetical protein